MTPHSDISKVRSNRNFRTSMAALDVGTIIRSGYADWRDVAGDPNGRMAGPALCRSVVPCADRALGTTWVGRRLTPFYADSYQSAWRCFAFGWPPPKSGWSRISKPKTVQSIRENFGLRTGISIIGTEQPTRFLIFDIPLSTHTNELVLVVDNEPGHRHWERTGRR